jgi:hypothetical protein
MQPLDGRDMGIPHWNRIPWILGEGNAKKKRCRHRSCLPSFVMPSIAHPSVATCHRRHYTPLACIVHPLFQLAAIRETRLPPYTSWSALCRRCGDPTDPDTAGLFSREYCTVCKRVTRGKHRVVIAGFLEPSKGCNWQDSNVWGHVIVGNVSVATNSVIDYNQFSSSIATTLTCRTHVKIFIDDCNYDYCRKKLQ